MEILRKIGFLSLIFLAIISAVVDIAYGFFCFFWKNTTEDVFNINDQTPVDIQSMKESGKLSPKEIDDLEDRTLFEVNLYANTDKPTAGKKNGIVLEELGINYFTNSSMDTASTIMTGMQYVSDYAGKQGLYTSSSVLTMKQKATGGENWWAAMGGELDALGKALNIIHEPSAAKEFSSETEANAYVSRAFNYYQKVGNSVTWNAMGLQTQLNRNTTFIVKIGGEAYKIKLDKYLDTRYDNRPSPEVAWLPWHWHQANDYGGKVEYYNWDMVFQDIMHAVTTNNMYTGTHYGVVNLDKYFTVHEHYNSEKKQWEPASEADNVVTYAVVKFNYHTSGAVSNVQSMFGVIADDPRFKVNEDIYDTDFGQAVVRIELTEDSFEKRYSETYGGYFLSLSADLKRRLSEMPPHIIDVFFTEGSMVSECKKRDDYPIVGFDANALDGVEIRSLDINWCLVGSDADFKFYLLNNSLRGTGLTAEKITANHEKLVNLNSGVEL